MLAVNKTPSELFGHSVGVVFAKLGFKFGIKFINT